MPFFSIIIPTYNRAELVTKTVKSVLDQSFGDLEVLVIDDGSTDRTKESLSIYNQDSRFKYIYQENTKESGARNNGMKIAKGDWVCLLDSDDFFLLNHLQVLHDSIIENDNKVGVYHTLITRVFPDGTKKNQDLVLRNPENAVWGINRNELIPSSSCMHKSIAKSYTFREDIFSGEDSEFFYRVALDFPIITIERITVEYMIHAQSSGDSYGGRHVFCANRILYWKAVRDNERLNKCFPKGFFNERISQLYQWKGMSHAATKDRLRTIGSYLMSMCYEPKRMVNFGFLKEMLALLK